MGHTGIVTDVGGNASQQRAELAQREVSDYRRMRDTGTGGNDGLDAVLILWSGKQDWNQARGGTALDQTGEQVGRPSLGHSAAAHVESYHVVIIESKSCAEVLPTLARSLSVAARRGIHRDNSS